MIKSGRTSLAAGPAQVLELFLSDAVDDPLVPTLMGMVVIENSLPTIREPRNTPPEKRHQASLVVGSSSDPQQFKALQKEIGEVLRDYLQGKNIQQIESHINLQVETMVEVLTIAKGEKLNKPGWAFLCKGSFNLAGNRRTRVNAYKRDITLRELMYRLMRQAIDEGDIKRLGVCRECNRLTFYPTFKGAGHLYPKCDERHRNSYRIKYLRERRQALRRAKMKTEEQRIKDKEDSDRLRLQTGRLPTKPK